jgi:hypothetical protein
MTLAAFFVCRGRFFRMMTSELTGTTHCNRPAPWSGRIADSNGEVWVVWACDEHVAELERAGCAV